jgi:transcriptional regulator with XRE-family HTH domain
MDKDSEIEKRKQLGNLIRQARASANISQEDLGKVLNVPGNVISRIELGQREVRFSEIKLIAEATGKPLDFFHEEEIKVSIKHSKDIVDLTGLTESRKEFIRKLKEEFLKENV